MASKKHLDRDLFVMDFVQFVSSQQTHAKRVRKIKKTMELCPSNLTDTQWMKMWRGFYYAIWYSEMRKGGEELIEEMGNYQNGSYLLAGFKSLTQSWSGIDAFRIDKYMFLLRIMLRNVLKQQITALLVSETLFKDNPFMHEMKKGSQTKPKEPTEPIGEEADKSKEANVIDYIVQETSKSTGLFLHVTDIYVDELQAVVQELIDDDSHKANLYYAMLIPFGKRLSTIQDERLRKSIRMNIFDKLMEQLISEPISIRSDTLSKFLDPLLEIASHTELGKNRNCLYSLVDKIRSKVSSLNSTTKDRVKLKRRIIGVDRKTKKIKYEVGTSTPFVRSLVPLPLI